MEEFPSSYPKLLMVEQSSWIAYRQGGLLSESEEAHVKAAEEYLNSDPSRKLYIFSKNISIAYVTSDGVGYEYHVLPEKDQQVCLP